MYLYTCIQIQIYIQIYIHYVYRTCQYKHNSRRLSEYLSNCIRTYIQKYIYAYVHMCFMYRTCPHKHSSHRLSEYLPKYIRTYTRSYTYIYTYITTYTEPASIRIVTVGFLNVYQIRQTQRHRHLW